MTTVSPSKVLQNWSLRAAAERCVRDGRSYCAELVTATGSRAAAKEIVSWLTTREQRRRDRQAAEQARGGEPGRMLRLAQERRAERERLAEERLRKRVTAGRVGRQTLARLIEGRYAHGEVGPVADGMLRAVVSAVGVIGEQAERDLDELLRTGEDFAGKRGKHHRLERTTIERIEHLPDWTAALVTLCDYRSFGSYRWGEYYGSRRGVSFRCYLIVRDATTGEAHVLRVPPRFGNSDTNFFHRFREEAIEQIGRCYWPWRPDATPSDEEIAAWNRKQKRWERRVDRLETELRIRAAIAWTFDLAPSEYQPAIEA